MLDALIFGYRTVFAAGVAVARRAGLNFTGAGVSSGDDSTGGTTDIIVIPVAAPAGLVLITLPNGGAYTMQPTDLVAGTIAFTGGNMATTITFPLSSTNSTAYMRTILNSTANACTLATAGGSIAGPAVNKTADFWFLPSGAPLRVSPDT
jgi:hypothetical protein